MAERVEPNIKTTQVQIYPNNVVALAGTYVGTPGLVGAHMGLCVNRNKTGLLFLTVISKSVLGNNCRKFVIQ